MKCTRTFNFNRFYAISYINLSNRIKQEEIRATQKVHSSNLINDNNATGNIFDTNMNSSAPTFSDSSSNESYTWTLSTDLCIYINAALIGGIFIIGNIRYTQMKPMASFYFVILKYIYWSFDSFRSLGFFQVCMRASQNIYSSMFNGLISTKMRFFDTNPSGRILNRFSKDIGWVCIDFSWIVENFDVR